MTQDELIERLRKELVEKTAQISRLESEINYWMGQAERLGHEADRLREERDALLQVVERSVDAEGQRLDHDPVDHRREGA